MSDIAILGFKVDTKGLKKGEQALDNFAKKGEQTEKRINNSFKRISARISGIKDVIGIVGLEFAQLSNKTDIARKLVVKDMQQMRNSVTDLNREVKKVPVGFGRISRSARTSSASAVTSITILKKEIISVNRVVGLLATGFLLIGGARLGTEIISLSDTWKGLNSQIRQVTDSEEDLIKTRKILFDLTQDTRSQLSGTVNLFAELTRGTSELDISSDRLVGVTRTLNNLFVAGGKPMSETIGAIRQLNQGFASGVLRGDEFNSVAEGAPKVLVALTRSLGITRGELREFAATGGITAEIMITALESFSREAQSLADQTEKTFAQSLQISTNNITKFVGEAELLNEILGSVGAGMEELTGNLDATSDAAQTMVAVIGVGLTPVMFGYIRSLVGTIAAQLTAGTTAIKTANAFSVVTTSAATATVATNALAIATKFLLGPWGLLLIAIGAAVGVYAASKAASEDITRQFGIEEEAIRKLAKSYEDASVGRLGSDYIKSQRKAIEIDKERNRIQENIISIQNRITAARASGAQFRDISQSINSLKDQKKALAAVNLKGAENAKVLKIIGDKFENLLPKGREWVEISDNIAKKTKDQMKAQLRVAEAFGLTIFNLEMQRQELLLSANAFEIYEAKIQAIADGATPAMVKAITDAIKVNQDLRAEIDNQEGLNELSDQVDNFGGAWSRTGSAIIDAFGGMSEALSDYMGRVEEIAELEAKVADARVIFGENNADVIRLQQELDSQKVSAELSGLKAISKASGSLFKEKTAASKAFAALNKIIAIAEIALSFQKITAGTAEAGVHVANETTKQGANSLTAITSAFAAPFPINFIAGAAMIAIMASLLGGSSGGGGGGFDASQAAQEAQGTGTVFGSNEQSQSIVNAQERFEDIAIDQLSELRKIRNSMGALADGIAKLAGSIIGGGLGEFGGNLGTTTSVTGGFLANLGDPFGGTVSAVLGSLFGKTTKKIVDEGISFIAQSLGSIIDQGVIEAQAFFDVETKKRKFFGLSKSTSTSTEFKDVNDAITTELGAIFSNIGNAVTESITLLGLTTNKSVNDFIINIGKISFKDLTGEEIQAELEAVFSQQADLLSTFLVPELANFQQIGEGLFETLIRVAQEQVIFNDALDFMGGSLSQLSNIMQIEVAQSIIGMVGGLERFSDLTNKFFDEFFTEEEKFERLSNSLNEAVSGLGISMFETRGAFRAAVEGVDKTTEAGQALFAGLLELAPAFDDFFDSIESDLRSALNSEIKGLRTLANNIDSISRTFGANAGQDLISALAGAKQGEFGAAQALNLRALTSLDPRRFESAEALAIQEAINRGRLATIGELAGAEATRAETELDALNQQVELTQEVADNTASIDEAISSIPGAVTSAAAITAESLQASNVVILETIRNELKDAREEDTKIQMQILRNSTTSANALQQFKLDGMDVREIS